MAASVYHGEALDVPNQGPVTGEDDILCELNAEFRRSKSELIHRFLKDQEELNHKFAEYELESEEDESGSESSGSPSSSRHSGPSESVEKQEIFDVLQDLEDKDLPGNLDNLSTTSAVNSSSDERSLSDCGDPGGYESCDIDDDAEHDENWNITDQQGRSPETYPIEYYDKFSRQGCHLEKQGPGRGSEDPQQQLVSIKSPQTQARKPKKNKDPSNPRKVKKVLVKKNVRPQTSMGVCGLPSGEDYLFDPHESDCGTVLQPRQSMTPRFTLHDSLRFKKISWTGASEDHPEMGRLSISASLHKLPPRSHTPGGRLKTYPNPLMSSAALSLKASTEYQRKGQSGNHHPELTQVRRSKAPVDILELSRAATPVRPDSSLSTYSRLSVDLPEQFASYRSRQGTPTTSGPHLMRSVYSAERGNSRIVMTPTLTDVKGSKKRPIAVLKLPPLDSGVVNRAIGATLETSAHGRQPPLVSPATAKSNSVATPSAI